MKAKIIALTGGIGSGKSLALEIIKNAGYKTLSSDEIVAELYQTRKVKKLLKALFPSAVTGFINLKIDRKKISEIVFSDVQMHKKLTSAITPLVLEQIKLRTRNCAQPVFVEVPLLFECGYQIHFDGVIVLVRPKDMRIESVKTRSKLTEEQIIARMNAQTDYDTFDLSPYKVILNDGDVEALKTEIISLAKKLTE